MIRIGADLKAPRVLGRPVATVGMFDGVHRGHQRVLADLRRWAQKLACRSLVVTFDRSPKSVIQGRAVPCITSLEHRLVLFERLGIDAAAVLRFDKRLRAMPAREFIRRVLIEKLRVRGVLLGFNGRFGRNAEGDYALLRELAAEGLCRARQSARPVRASGLTVSSSAIRAAIEAGRLREAEAMLGRPVSILGTVVHGFGIGSRLGFPTANLDLHHEVRPPAGVYAGSARVGRTWRPALTSIGSRPTIHPRQHKEVVEVLIPGLRRDLYGQDIEVRFVCKLRDQVRFGSEDALVEQIRRDVAALKGEQG